MYGEIQDPYEMDNKKRQVMETVQYWLAKFFKAIFYILKLLFKIALQVVLDVLQAFGIKIGSRV